MVYVFLAEGFEEVEALGTVDFLRRAGIETVTVGIGGKKVIGSHKIQVEADTEDSDILLGRDTEAVVLPGGMPGTLNLEASANVKKAVEFCLENSRYVCAICAAPSVLGHMGVLKSVHATCYPGYEKDLIGAIHVDSSAVTDGKIITGNGPGAVFAFSREIISALRDKNTAERVMSAAQVL